MIGYCYWLLPVQCSAAVVVVAGWLDQLLFVYWLLWMVVVELWLSGPNGDGVHDFLKMPGVEAYPQNTLIIYNKNGQKVYETTGYNNSTNSFTGVSSDGEELANGTYYFYLNIGSDQKSGYFLLQR